MDQISHDLQQGLAKDIADAKRAIRRRTQTHDEILVCREALIAAGLKVARAEVIDPAPPPPPPTPDDPPLGKPTAPLGLVVSIGDGTLGLSWQASPAAEQVDLYQVYVDDAYAQVLDVPGPSATLTGLTDGRAYSVRVGASNAAGYGPWGPSITATPGVTPPPPPDDPPPPPPPPSTGDLFANPWPLAAVRQPVPANEPDAPNSVAMVAAFVTTARNIGGANSPRRWQGTPADPVWTLTNGSTSHRVYAPQDVIGSQSSYDDTLEVYNPVAPDGSAHLVVRQWGGDSVRLVIDRNAHTIRSSTIGAARIDGDGKPFQGSGTAWGLFSSVSVLLAQELAAGVCPHAIGVALGNNLLSPSKFIPPATRSEGKASGSLVEMGRRFQIVKPWPEIEAVLGSRFTGATLDGALTLWRALHVYGAIIRDGTGNDGSWFYRDAEGTDVLTSTVLRGPTELWAPTNWRVPARSVYS